MIPERMNRTVIYESDWVNLYTDKVKYPNGDIIEKYHVLHYDHDSVVVVIENDKDEILLIKSNRYVTGSQEWEVPAGRIEKDETAIMAAKRETLEETGYDIDEIIPVCSFNPNNGTSDLVIHLCKAKAIRQICDFDINEVESIRWFSKKEIKEMLINNEIYSGVSMIALLYTFIL